MQDRGVLGHLPRHHPQLGDVPLRAVQRYAGHHIGHRHDVSSNGSRQIVQGGGYFSELACRGWPFLLASGVPVPTN